MSDLSTQKLQIYFPLRLKAAADPGEKLRISRLIGIKRLAAGVTEELDAVYKTLLK